MIKIGNDNTCASSPIGKRQRRRSMFLRSIAAVLIPVMTLGPDTVLAMHNEAMAYRAISEAIAAAAVAQVGTAETFTYDNNGNLTSHASPSDGVTNVYGYDGENRLIFHEEHLDGSPTASSTDFYDYDADGVRRWMQADGAGTHYLTDKNRDFAQVLVESSGADPIVPATTAVTYAYGDDLISQNRAGAVRYYHYDGQLSTRQLSDSPLDPIANPPGVTDTYTFDAFGNLSASTL